MKTLRNLRLIGATGTIRTATYNDREHLVVPIVAMVEGVVWAMNSEVPEFVPAEELAQTPHQWNGRGCFAGHPEDNGSQITANTPRTLEKSFGLIFDTVDSARILQTRALEFNAWIDPTKAELVGTASMDVVRRLRAGERVEVSIGCYVEALDEDGEYEGRKYHGRWTNIVSDHLAFIAAGEKGACSIQDGCGAPRSLVRHAVSRKTYNVTSHGDRTPQIIEKIRIEKETPMPVPKAAASGPPAPPANTKLPPKRGLLARVAAMLAQYRDAETGMSDIDLRNSIDAALRAVEPGYQGIDEIYPDGSETFEGAHVIYYVMPEDKWMTKRRSYTMTEGGVATLTENAVEVEAVTEYKPVRAAEAAHTPCSCGQQARQAEQKPTEEKPNMDRVAIITALMQNALNPIKNQKALEAFTDAELTTFEAQVKATAAPTTTVTDTTVPVAAPTTAAAKDAPAPMTTEDWLKTAPAEIRDMYENKKAVDAARHAELVTILKTAAAGVLTEEQLKTKPLAELETLAALAKVGQPEQPVDYSQRGFPRAAAAKTEKEDFTPPNPYKRDLEARKAQTH